MSLTEFDEEECKRIWREDGIYEVSVEIAKNLINQKILSPEQIAEATDLPLAEVLELAQNKR